jgi:thiopurine S-methyltransferase
MESSFWHKRWESNEIGFHEYQANSLLVKYAKELALSEGSRIFVPLCGKTCDIPWLLANGYRVAGAELSRLAVEQLFQDNRIEPIISELGKLVRYSAENIDIFVGDIFDLSLETLGPVDATYDRAALVALPEEMRQAYTKHLIKITANKTQFLISFEYDQHQMSGPPFSINKAELNKHYLESYTLSLIDSGDVKGGLKGRYPAIENAWLLGNK